MKISDEQLFETKICVVVSQKLQDLLFLLKLHTMYICVLTKLRCNLKLVGECGRGHLTATTGT